MNFDTLVTEAEARKRLNLPVHTLPRLRHLHKGPAYTRLGRLIYYRLEDLDAWVNACSVTPTTSQDSSVQKGGDHD